jgi:hypothetical protein
MVNQSKKNDSIFWAKWRASGAVGQLLSNYKPTEQEIRGYEHLKSTQESPREERIIDYKGKQLLLVHFRDKDSRIMTLVPGIVMGYKTRRSTDFHISDIALLPRSQRAEVRDLAKNVFPSASGVYIW